MEKLEVILCIIDLPTEEELTLVQVQEYIDKHMVNVMEKKIIVSTSADPKYDPKEFEITRTVLYVEDEDYFDISRYAKFRARVYRKETEKEFQIRIERNKELEEQNKRRETALKRQQTINRRKQYERLKKEFEPDKNEKRK